MKSIFALTISALLFLIMPPAVQYARTSVDRFFTVDDETKNPYSRADIQLALLLDTSNSMDGLIDQAKGQLWNIVNEMSNASKMGDDIQFEIALYEYGNSSLPAYKNYIRQISSFTSDVDLISEKLFALSTKGGEEYCGAVLHTSLSELAWSNHSSLKTIYIAGNESFDQGGVSFTSACNDARAKNVKINTIFCGNYNQGINLKWLEGARTADGAYSSINQNEQTVHIASPYDDKIAELNNQLNDTYIYYGKKGKISMENQKTQDSNANAYGKANFVKRSIFKSKSQYKNTEWDLVDAYEEDAEILENVKDLPEAYKHKSKEVLEKDIKALAQKRERIKKEIGELGKRRIAYTDQERQKTKEVKTLDDKLIGSLKKQLKEAGFNESEKVDEDKPAKVDYKSFLTLGNEVELYRKGRLIDITKFNEMSKDEHTIILDTRSKEAYEKVHLDKAIHLNFSDFTADKLASIIPNKQTRILIYCNNNVESSAPALALKVAPLALNIPTFINLYGYGYKNLYELKSYIKDDDSRLKLINSAK
jgi:rhodanese-related sulfurtransferase